MKKKKDIYMIGNIQDNNIFASQYNIEIKDPLGLKTFLSKNKISDTLKENNEDIKNSNNKKIGKVYKINTESRIKEQNKSKFEEVIYELYLFNEELKK